MCESDYKLCAARLSLMLGLVKELFEAAGVLPINEELSSLLIYLTADHQSLCPVRLCGPATQPSALSAPGLKKIENLPRQSKKSC